MLVVTFTERAAAELVRRIRALISRCCDRVGDDDDAGAHVWTIDAAARERLEAATRGLDVAPISTIHAFCQRMLTEHAFASGRLLAQSQVESRTAFTAAFDEVIRGPPRRRARRAARRPGCATGSDVGGMEDAALPGARSCAATGRRRSIPTRLARAARAFAASRLDGRAARSRCARSNKRRARPSRPPRDAARRLHAASATHGRAGAGCSPRSTRCAGRTIFAFVSTPIGWAARATSPASRRCWRTRGAGRRGDPAGDRGRPALRAARRGTAARAQARRRASTTSTTCWRWSTRRCAARAARELAATLRARYRLAVIDEFQDTDPVQWEIFRTIFLDGGGARPLVPRRRSQAGDLRLPRRRRQHLRRRARHGDGARRRRITCERNFRSTPAVIDTYNAIFDQQAPKPFFSTG